MLLPSDRSLFRSGREARGVQVRELRSEAEAGAVIEVRRRAWEAAYAGLLPPDALRRAADGGDYDAASLVADARRAEETVLVARDDAGVTGFAVALTGERCRAFVPETGAELRAIYVAPERWGEGVGTRLLDAVRTRLDPETALHLEVFAANDRARSFYERRGFAPVGNGSVTVAGATRATKTYSET